MSLTKQMQQYTKDAQDGIYTHGVNQKRQSQGQVTESFARGGLDSMSSRDDIMREKMEFLKAGGDDAMTPFGQVTATDADFMWLQKKREKEAAANLDTWVGTNFHTNDVVTRKWLQEVFPEYYEERERLMMERAKFALRVKLLLLRGPKNHKDLILMWGLQTGQISLDRDWDKIGSSTSENSSAIKAEEQKRFKNGLMNPRRYLSTEERGTNQMTPNGNPFKPLNQSAGGGQGARGSGVAPNLVPAAGAPFMGGAVPNAGRYPAFLTKLLA